MATTKNQKLRNNILFNVSETLGNIFTFQGHNRPHHIRVNVLLVMKSGLFCKFSSHFCSLTTGIFLRIYTLLIYYLFCSYAISYPVRNYKSKFQNSLHLRIMFCVALRYDTKLLTSKSSPKYLCYNKPENLRSPNFKQL